MKRFHVNVTVRDLPASINFYTRMFGAEPFVQQEDYAKWLLDDPRLNFALTTHGAQAGISHVGLQVDSDEELDELRRRALGTQSDVFEQPEVQCCYAHSSKAWVRDPDGVAWEAFLTHGQAGTYGDGTATSPDSFDREAEKSEPCCTR